MALPQQIVSKVQRHCLMDVARAGRSVLHLCYLGKCKLHLVNCSLCVPLMPSALPRPAWALGCLSFPPSPDFLVSQCRCQGDLQALCGADPVLPGQDECVAGPCWAGVVKPELGESSALSCRTGCRGCCFVKLPKIP